MAKLFRRQQSPKDTKSRQIHELMEAQKSLLSARLRLKRDLERMRGLKGDEGTKAVEESLETLDLILERLSLRIETLVVTGVVDWKGIATIATVVKKLMYEYNYLDPGITREISEAGEALSRVWMGFEPSASEDLKEGELATVDEEAKKVIEEAEAMIRKERSKKAGEAASQT
ncbi:MAG: hypothetical protein RXO54_02100 [Acidilobus sp.]